MRTAAPVVSHERGFYSIRRKKVATWVMAPADTFGPDQPDLCNLPEELTALGDVLE